MCILPCESGNRMPGFLENAGGEAGMNDFNTQINRQEAAIVNDQSNFYGKFGEIVEETDIGYRIKLNESTSVIYFLKEEVETFE